MPCHGSAGAGDRTHCPARRDRPTEVSQFGITSARSRAHTVIRIAEKLRKIASVVLALAGRLTLSKKPVSKFMREAKMSKSSRNLPTSGYAIVIDGLVKTEFATRDGVEAGARDLKRRFPMLQVKIYDAAAEANLDVGAC